MPSRFSVFGIICENQTRNGIVVDDYYRYRRFCRQRIHGLCSGPKPLKQDKTRRRPTSPKSPPGTALRRVLTEDEQKLLTLLEAERCSAHAMEIRSETASEPRKLFHERKRWKRAIKHANALVDLLKEDPNGEQRRALIYRQGLQANLCFAYQRWQSTALHFARYIELLESVPAADTKMRAFIEKLIANATSFHRYSMHMASSLPAAATEDIAVEADALMDIDQDVSNEHLKLKGHLWAIPREQHSSVDKASSQVMSKTFSLHDLPNTLATVKLYLRCCREAGKLGDIIHSIEGNDQWLLAETLKATTHEEGHQSLRKISYFIRKLANLGKHLTTLAARADVPSTLVPEIGRLKEWIYFYRRALKTLKHLCRRERINWDQLAVPQHSFQSLAFPVVFEGERAKGGLLRTLQKLAGALDLGLSKFGMREEKPPRATMLETLDRFVLFRDMSKAALDPVMAPQMVPMKPVFYDLAHDLLETPTIRLSKP